jgi:adenylate cyclase
MALAGTELRFWQGGAEAMTAADRAIALDGQIAEPFCARALGFEEQGKSEEAQAAIEAALRLDPASWEAHRTAAQLLFRNGAFARAIPHLERAAKAPDHASAALLISCCQATRDGSGVRRAAQLAVKIAELVVISDPASGCAFASAARGFAALGELGRARKWVRKAVAVDPGNLAMRYSLAATAASFFKDKAMAIELVEPFAETTRAPPHLQLLEGDPSFDAIRQSAPFQEMLQRARKRVEALSPVS